MADVPTFSVPDVALDATPPQYQQADLGGFAAANNRAKQISNIGAGVGDIAKTGFDIAIQQAQQQNTQQATDLDNQLSASLRTIAFGDGTADNPGFFAAKGQNAVDAAPAAQAAIAQTTSDILANAGANPRVQQMYKNQAAQRVNALLTQVDQHVSDQRTVAQSQTFATRQSEAFNNAAANYNNPQELKKQTFISVQAAQGISALNGESPEATAYRGAQAASDVAKSAILSALSQQDTTTAMGLFQANKTVLLGQDLVDVQKMVQAQTLASRAQNLAGTAANLYPGDMVKQADYIRKNATGDLQDAAVQEAQSRNSIIHQQEEYNFSTGQQTRTLGEQGAQDAQAKLAQPYIAAAKGSPTDALAAADADQQTNPDKNTPAQWNAIRAQLSTYVSDKQNQISTIEAAQRYAMQDYNRKRTIAADQAADNAGADFKTYFMTAGKTAAQGLSDLDAAQQANPNQFTQQQWNAMRGQGQTYVSNADMVATVKQKQEQKTIGLEAQNVSDNVIGANSDQDTKQFTDVQGALDAAKQQNQDDIAAAGNDPDKIAHAMAVYNQVQANIKERADTQKSLTDQAVTEMNRNEAQRVLEQKQTLQDTQKSVATFLQGGGTIAQWTAANSAQHPDQVSALLGDFGTYNNAEHLQDAIAAGKPYAEVPNEALTNKLMAMGPGLATENLALYQPQVSKPEYDKLVTAQNGAIKQQGAIENSQVYSAGSSLVDQYLPADFKKNNNDQVNILKNEMNGFISDTIAKTDKVPSRDDMVSYLNNIVAPMTTGPRFWSTDQGYAGVFTAQSSPKQISDTISTIRTPIASISQPIKKSISTYLDKNFDAKPTEISDDVMEHLAGLAALGQTTPDLKLRQQIQTELNAAILNELNTERGAQNRDRQQGTQ